MIGLSYVWSSLDYLYIISILNNNYMLNRTEGRIMQNKLNNELTIGNSNSHGELCSLVVSLN